MIHNSIFNQVNKLFVLISISILLTGCMATQKALRKVNADRQFLGYESVYISKDMDIVLNYKVRFNKHGRFTGTDETWCAKLPLEETYNQSQFVGEVCRLPILRYAGSPISKTLNSSKGIDEIRSLPCISTDDYIIEKNMSMMAALKESDFLNFNSKCHTPGDDFVRVVSKEYRNDLARSLKASWSGKADEIPPPVSFMSPNSWLDGDKSYIVFTKHDPKKTTYSVVKVDQPLPQKEYDLVKIASLPYYIVLDVVAIPMYLFLIAVGPF